jgi:SanA protein
MKKLKFLKRLLLIGFFAVIASSILVYTIVTQTQHKFYTNSNDVPPAEVAIVFGAGIKPNNSPSQYLRDRLDAGMVLYKNFKVKKILLTGDNSRFNYDELGVMKRYLQTAGVDTADIYIDCAGFDTYSSVWRAKIFFGIRSAILVSQNYHLHRCLYLANAMGIHAMAYSATKGHYTFEKFNKLRECAAILKSVLDNAIGRKPKYHDGYIDINGPSNYSANDK